ncbi:Schizosaccharomyces specific protein Meu31 [Schizosaccharomyces osmophilus]|uniref:Schizosaccharomyces specific protein Meu31 n=1 Tax=Schizosaccharomyces osmophilus TaxID=2545709 RepID=A0AAE9WC49_9SCHI|nr:Schizosaccharomyces specific protein Meu31 [Schizosaccharomyces osmophilus]WBW71948.1 Schizosaccharomyces specific protein Meu31 [Schizosaccharomyces osmophilus]
MPSFSKVFTFLRSIEYVKIPCLFMFAAIVGMNLSLLYCLLRGWKHVGLWGIGTLISGFIGTFLAYKKKISWSHLLLLWSTTDAFFSMCLRSCVLIYFSMNPYILCEVFGSENVMMCSANMQKVFMVIVAASNLYSFFQLGCCLLVFNNVIKIHSIEDVEIQYISDGKEQEIRFQNGFDLPEKPIQL